MGALIVVVAVSVAVFYWAMGPLLQVLSDLMQLSFLPWLLLALGIWLLAGRAQEDT
ncbi:MULTISPECIES: hypothetical protein [Cyanobium]|jgi:hypothetical protein|uniref:hypothetical protein n=1 Tax=Cyanobium TaxID=167375 RepID=UPI00137AA969|nr:MULTISPECIES: hypothetical protein [Cyanobium]MCP9780712.1 hypothetical protein [Cyanobium sp. To12R1]MCP9822878.1 hypothetical protein [Cyanobium sp. L1E-Cus]